MDGRAVGTGGRIDPGYPGPRRRAETTAEHRLHLLRRPRLPGDQRLRRPAQAPRHAEHRPDRQRRRAVRPLPGARTRSAGRAGPRSSPASTATRTGFTTTPTAGSTARRSPSPSCSRRPATRPPSIGKWHLVSDPTGFDYWHILPGPGRVLQPADDRQRQAGQARRVRHRPHHRLVARLAEEARQVQAVPADVPAQGPAPRVVAGPATPRARQGPQVPGAGHAVRRLRRPRQGRARPGHDHREDVHPARREARPRRRA